MYFFGVCSLGNDSDVDIDRKEDEREKTPKRPRVQKTERTPSTKETEQVPGPKNPIISVVLTAHEAIPGNQNHQSVYLMLILYKIVISLRLNCLECTLREKILYLVLFGHLDSESLHLAPT